MPLNESEIKHKCRNKQFDLNQQQQQKQQQQQLHQQQEQQRTVSSIWVRDGVR